MFQCVFGDWDSWIFLNLGWGDLSDGLKKKKKLRNTLMNILRRGHFYAIFSLLQRSSSNDVLLWIVHAGFYLDFVLSIE